MTVIKITMTDDQPELIPGKGWKAYTAEELQELSVDACPQLTWTPHTFAVRDAIAVYYDEITTEQVAEVCGMTWRDAYDELIRLAEYGFVHDYIEAEDDEEMDDDERRATVWSEPESPWPEDWDAQWEFKVQAATRMGLTAMAEKFAADLAEFAEDEDE